MTTKIGKTVKTELTEKLNNFFTSETDPKDFAKRIRRMNFLVSSLALKGCISEYGLDEKWADDGHYWLNNFAEVLDPNLDVD